MPCGEESSGSGVRTGLHPEPYPDPTTTGTRAPAPSPLHISSPYRMDPISCVGKNREEGSAQRLLYPHSQAESFGTGGRTDVRSLSTCEPREALATVYAVFCCDSLSCSILDSSPAVLAVRDIAISGSS